MSNRTLESIAVAAVVSLVVVTGCTEANPVYQPGPELPEECRAGSEVSETFEQFERPEKLDLWFVVSNTEGMESHQQRLAEAVPSLLTRLEDEEMSVHAAVSTMDATADPGLAPIVDDVDGCETNNRQVAKSGNSRWIQNLECNLQQSTDGDRRPRPLDAIESSLLDDPSSIDEFRRDDARLVAVMLSEQDDCSGAEFDDDSEETARDLCAWQSEELRDIDDWLDSIRQTATVPEGLSVAVIGGPPAEVSYEQGEAVRAVCSSTLGSAYPSPRMRSVTRALGAQGLFSSICVFDFFDHLDELAQRLAVQDKVTLCASEPMAHEPLEVVGIDADGERRDLDFGPGFEFAGVTDECEEGAIRLRRQASESLQRLEMTYCGLSD